VTRFGYSSHDLAVATVLLTYSVVVLLDKVRRDTNENWGSSQKQQWDQAVGAAARSDHDIDQAPIAAGMFHKQLLKKQLIMIETFRRTV
jgi:hypothetical protein